MSNNFVDNDIVSGSIDAALPGVKVDSGPETGPANQNLDALEFNNTESAITDIKTVLTRSITGDLSGAYNTGPTVVALQGVPVSVTVPINGQGLVYNGSQYVPETILASGATAGGDLSGTYPNPTVKGLRGISLSITAPTAGQVLTYSGGLWTPVTPSGGGGGVVTGDLSGTVPGSIEVVGLQNNPLLASSPSQGDVLVWNGTQWFNTPTPSTKPLPQANIFSTGIYDAGQNNFWSYGANPTANVATTSSDNPANLIVPLQNGEMLLNCLDSLGTVNLYTTAGQWVATGSLVNPCTALSSFSQVVLQNGKVLAVGLGSSTQDCNLYDPVAGTWSATGTQLGALNRNSIILLQNGKVLGLYTNGGVSGAALYDPGTGLWTASGNLPILANLPTMAVLPNGNVLLATGGTATTYIYSVSGGTWAATTNNPTATPSLYTGSITLANGNVLLTIGGSSAVTNIYNHTTGLWAATGNLPFSPASNTSANLVLLSNGNIFGIFQNGIAGDMNVALYNTTGATWSSLHSPLTSALGSFTLASYNSAVLLSTGSVLFAPGGGVAVSEIYTFTVGNWTTTGTLTAGNVGTDTTTGYSLSTYTGVTTASFQFTTPWGAGQAAGDYVFSCYVKTNAISSFGVTLNYNGGTGTSVQVVPTGETDWQVDTNYGTGTVVQNFGAQYQATTGGISAPSGNGPTGTGGSISDGSVTWTYVQPAGQYVRVQFPFTYPGGGASYLFGINFTSLPSTAQFSVGLFAVHQGRTPADYTFPGNTSEALSVQRNVYFGTAVPTSTQETYQRGDLIWNTTPTSGSPVGWVCIVQGSPGTWQSFGTGSSPTGSAGGDLSGSYPNPQVAQLQGNPVSNSTPTMNQVLTWNGSQWTPETPSGSGAGGDLTGSYPNPTIAKLQGNTVSAASPTTGYVLTWNGTAWIPASVGTSSTPTGPATGDLGGSYPAPEVVSALNDALAFTSTAQGTGVKVVTASTSLLLEGNAPATSHNAVVITNAVQLTSGNLLSFQNPAGSEVAHLDYAGNLGVAYSVYALDEGPLNLAGTAPSGAIVQLQNGATNLVTLTTTQLQLNNGITGIYQQASSDLVLAGNNSGGYAITFQNGGTVIAEMDIGGNTYVALGNSSNPSLVIGPSSGTGPQNSTLFLNGITSSTLHQSSVTGSSLGGIGLNSSNSQNVSFSVNSTVQATIDHQGQFTATHLLTNNSGGTTITGTAGLTSPVYANLGDTGGSVQFTGAAHSYIAGDTVFTISFGENYPNGSCLIIQAANQAAAALFGGNLYCGSANSSVGIATAVPVTTASTTYSFKWVCIGN